MDRNIKQIDDYQIYLNEKLGNGSFGSVYKGVKKSIKEPVAIKMISKLNSHKAKLQLQTFLKEVQIMDNLNHPNIVKYYDGFESRNNYYIVQQLCECDLATYLEHSLKANKKHLPEDAAIDILKQICSGCLYLAQKGIVHRDLKPQNILVSRGAFKIADFGLSKKNLTKNIKNQTLAGTPSFMAPEIMKMQRYTSKCDIWSIGVIFYVILHGRTPWIGRSLQEIAYNTHKVPLLINQSKFSKNAVDFIRKALKIKESQRFSWKQMLSHPIFDNHFQEFIKQHQKLDYKCQSFARQLRLKMQTENKSMADIVNELRCKSKKGLDYEQFTSLLKLIEQNLSHQEINHIFQAFDLDGNGFVSVLELENAAREINQKKSKPKYVKRNDQLSDGILQTVFRTLLIIKKKCQKENLNIGQYFENAKIHGLMSKNEFKWVLRNFDSSLSDQQLQELFVYFDKKNNNNVQVSIFLQIFTKCTKNL